MFAARLGQGLVRRAVTGRWGRLSLNADTRPPFPDHLRRLGLYLHVPFCRTLCPFCPYNRFVYGAREFQQFQTAVCQEIDLYAPHLAGAQITSLYIGGGTPTIDLPGLRHIVTHLKRSLPPIGSIAVELHPAFMNDRCLDALRELGVGMVSIGVESTADRLLSRIGRGHDSRMALDAVWRARRAGFDTVNADLLFALPTQTVAEWSDGVARVLDAGAHQLSTYPLFSFSYSELGRTSRLSGVRQPPPAVVRAMLEVTDRLATRHGLQRCAVWSWIDGARRKFSSVSRHHYIGFGPSASSMVGSHFYVNTFDVAAYARSLPAARPIALSMPMDARLEMAYWLYWRMYELYVGEEEFGEVFGRGRSVRGTFGPSIAALCILGLMERADGGFRVTPAGAYWIHRAQNHYSLGYINRLWGACRGAAWPREVIL
jgi:oxygen-independent coproporphyrinogen-3 oxidase